jgi:hypothetical protein
MPGGSMLVDQCSSIGAEIALRGGTLSLLMYHGLRYQGDGFACDSSCRPIEKYI